MAREPVHVRKVLLLAPEMAARGTSECTFNLAKELQRMAVEVSVFCAPGPMLENLSQAGIPVQTFEHLENMSMRFGEQKKLVGAVEQFAPQIVHAHTHRMAGALKLLDKNADLPEVLTLHWLPRGLRGLRKVAGRIDGVIATTQSVREELVNRCGVPKRKVKVIHNGIDVDRLMSRTIPPIFRSDMPVVGSLGPIEEKRGHELFVRAVDVLIAQGVEAQFVIAGQGGELPDVRRLIAELELQHRVTVAADFSAYEDVLAALDIVVQSSQVDVSGFSILESMGHGRPVIAFNTGTACEIIDDGKTGLLVPKGDVEALARAIHRLIADQDDAQRMGQDAQRAVERGFNIRSMALETLRYYSSILSARTSPST